MSLFRETNDWRQYSHLHSFQYLALEMIVRSETEKKPYNDFFISKEKRGEAF